MKRDAQEEAARHGWWLDRKLSFSGDKTKRSYLSGNFTDISIGGEASLMLPPWPHPISATYLNDFPLRTLVSHTRIFLQEWEVSPQCSYLEVSSKTTILEQLDLSLCWSHFDILTKAGEVLKWKALWFCTLRCVSFEILQHITNYRLVVLLIVRENEGLGKKPRMKKGKIERQSQIERNPLGMISMSSAWEMRIIPGLFRDSIEFER